MKERIQKKQFNRWLRGRRQDRKRWKDKGHARRYLARLKHERFVWSFLDWYDVIDLCIVNRTPNDITFNAALIGTKQESP